MVCHDLCDDLISLNTEHRCVRSFRLEGEAVRSFCSRVLLTSSGVEVKFDNGRAREKMKLVITVSGKNQVKHKIAENGAVAWKGNM
jgi:hypothetical protein